LGRGAQGTLILVAVLAGGCLAPHSTVTQAPVTDAAPPSRQVYVVDHGWHVGLAVKPADVSPDAWPEVSIVARFGWVEVGWGAGEFYPAASPSIGLALRAAFASTTSVLHVAAFDGSVEMFFPQAPLVELWLSTEGFDRLTRFVRDTYATDTAGNPIILGPGLYGSSSTFYRARGTYRWFNNSNHWAARALRAAGCPINTTLALTAGNVMVQASRLGRAMRSPASRSRAGSSASAC